MAQDQVNRARANYNRLSAVYGALTAGTEARLTAAAVRDGLQPRSGERILDVGCGTGRALADIARLVGPAGRAVGVDVSEKMLECARRAQARSSAAAHLLQGDATALPFAGGTFDAVFASFALETLGPGIGQALDEIRRVLVVGGRLCAVSIADHGGFGPMTGLYAAAHRRLPTLVDCRPLDAEDIVAARGFTVTHVRRAQVWGLPVTVVAADAG